MGCNTSQEKPVVTPQVDDDGVAGAVDAAMTTAENGTAAVLLNGASDAAAAAAPAASPSVNGKATDVAPLAAPDAINGGDEEDSVLDSLTTPTKTTAPSPTPAADAAQCNGAANGCDDEPAAAKQVPTSTATTTAATAEEAHSGAVVLNGEVMGKAEGLYRWFVICVCYYPNCGAVGNALSCNCVYQ